MFDYWGDSGTGFESELQVLSDGYKRAGFQNSTFVVPTAQFRDAGFRSSFKGIYSTTSGAASIPGLSTLTSTSIATAANRFIGGNYGAWSNPEYDRLFDAWSSTLDSNERARQVVQMVTIMSQDPVVLPLFFTFEVAAHISGLKGPDPNTATFGELMWNVHEWELKG